MKILLIEDHADVSTFLKKGLQYENFLVDLAVDGETALKKVETHKYDIIILDLLLPKVDGLEFLEEIRKQGNTTPVLILTAIHDVDTKVKLLNLGADDYLEKPFSFNELLARVQSILRRSKDTPKKKILRVSDLVLNPSTREVLRGGKSLKLRNKEFSLLEYLMNHEGEVISRTILMEQVWDINADVFSNTVETHISSLRRKVDEGQKQELIKTIHGVGYKISRNEE